MSQINKQEKKVGMDTIYKQNIQSIHLANQLIEMLRTQNRKCGIIILRQFIKKLTSLLQMMLANLQAFDQLGYTIDSQYLLSIVQSIAQAQEQEDYILVADLVELQVLPLLHEIQTVLRQNGMECEDTTILEENLQMLEARNPELVGKLRGYAASEETICETNQDELYQIEATSIGLSTLLVQRGKTQRYVCSNADPVREARSIAQTWYQYEIEDYTIFGLGLGYHAEQLWRKNPEMELTILEPELAMIYHCLRTNRYRDMLSSSQVHLVYDPDYKVLLEFTQKYEEERQAFVIHLPSMQLVREERIRTALDVIFTKQNSAKEAIEVFYQNSQYNFSHCIANVDSLCVQFSEKNVIIVAAGPSLDSNVQLLKKKSPNTIIVATGTIFRKLLAMKIAVDYVIITDAHTVNQVQGVEKETVPMLVLSTTSRTVTRAYQGDKYLICQKGYPRAEQYAAQQGHHLYETGGSVITTALDVSIRLGARTIAFIGLDLAYYDNKAHATATGKEVIQEMDEMEQVEAVDGTLLHTSRVFNMYRRWIENRVKKADVTIPIVDATEGGARIQGLQLMTLLQYMKENL